MNIEHLKLRSAVVKAIRRFFDERGYTEMHTPRLVGFPGQEPYLESFETSVSSPSSRTPNPVPCTLITSPEYAMKRLLANGMDKIYDLGPCFRNDEPWDGTHDPEFLMLEWYWKNGDLESLMKETEEMIRCVNIQIPNSKFQILDPVPRVTCEQAWKSVTGTDLASL